MRPIIIGQQPRELRAVLIQPIPGISDVAERHHLRFSGRVRREIVGIRPE
jgi:hypothetical protein